MSNRTSNKTIAKNTVFLYIRMLFSMVITLFTSRIILNSLGVEDYGIYQTVGGMIGMLFFIQAALAAGTSRFLMYENGTGDFDKLKKTFSSIFIIHTGFGLFVILLAETVGIWFFYNKLNIPIDRQNAAMFAFQMTIISSFFALTQIPYYGCIIAHERMSIYAYSSIVESILKLAIVFYLYISPYDKLIVYALLLCIVQIGMMLVYRFYCLRNLPETRHIKSFDKTIAKGVIGYSGWNLFSNIAIALYDQGGTILLNIFFNPSVVAARAVASQVNMAANQFVNNFRTATNPQIVKRYAAKEYDSSKQLLLNSTRFSYFMMLVLCLPIYYVSDQLLYYWLGIVPEYSILFLKIAVITSLFQVFDSCFYTALYAKGQIKENALIHLLIGVIAFSIIYILFKMNSSPYTLAYVLLVMNIIFAIFIKPILLIKIVDYSTKDFITLFSPCILVSIASIFVSLTLIYLIEVFFQNEILIFVLKILSAVVCVAVSVYYIGCNASERSKVIQFIKNKNPFF